MPSKERASAVAASAATAAVEAANLVKNTAELTAAALVKFTAENTKLATNIEYIQRDLAELKQDFKESKLKYIDATQHSELCKSNADHESRVRVLEQFQQNWIGKMSIIGGVASVIISGLFLLIEHLIK